MTSDAFLMSVGFYVTWSSKNSKKLLIKKKKKKKLKTCLEHEVSLYALNEWEFLFFSVIIKASFWIMKLNRGNGWIGGPLKI